MSWSRDEVGLLITEYQKWPNLYNIKSPNYKNRNLRRRSLEAILEAFKGIKTVTAQEVQTKFQALKQNAAKERKKCLESQKSGAGVDEVVEPSLWYYPIISYIFDNCDPRPSMDSLEDNPEDFQAFEVIEETTEGDLTEEVFSGVISPDGTVVTEDFEIPCSPSEQNTQLPTASRCSSSMSMSGAPKRKRKGNEDSTVLGKVSESLQSISTRLRDTRQVSTSCTEEKKTANETFGAYVVSKLDKMNDDDIRDSVEADIINILNNALKKCRQAQ